jgi:hypothetical protein
MPAGNQGRAAGGGQGGGSTPSTSNRDKHPNSGDPNLGKKPKGPKGATRATGDRGGGQRSGDR